MPKDHPSHAHYRKQFPTGLEQHHRDLLHSTAPRPLFPPRQNRLWLSFAAMFAVATAAAAAWQWKLNPDWGLTGFLYAWIACEVILDIRRYALTGAKQAALAVTGLAFTALVVVKTVAQGGPGQRFGLVLCAILFTVASGLFVMPGSRGDSVAQAG